MLTFICFSFFCINYLIVIVTYFLLVSSRCTLQAVLCHQWANSNGTINVFFKFPLTSPPIFLSRDVMAILWTRTCVILFLAKHGNYRLITLIFKKYGNLPLCLENCALFSLPPIFTNNLSTYTLRYIIYLGEPFG